MTTTSSIGGGAASLASAAQSRQNIADNFETFLGLLTTQLKNQNPLDPLDTNQFTQQLVQFASVEQQIRTNETLEGLVAINRAAQVTTALGFLGSEVTAQGTNAQLSGGRAEWRFTSPKPATGIVTVRDAQGNTVFSEERALSAGENNFRWDGRSSTGRQMPDGVYSISVSARDANNQSVTVSSEIRGIVDGIDTSGTIPMLKIGALTVPVDKITSVRRI